MLRCLFHLEFPTLVTLYRFLTQHFAGIAKGSGQKAEGKRQWPVSSGYGRDLNCPNLCQ